MGFLIRLCAAGLESGLSVIGEPVPAVRPAVPRTLAQHPLGFAPAQAGGAYSSFVQGRAAALTGVPVGRSFPARNSHPGVTWRSWVGLAARPDRPGERGDRCAGDRPNGAESRFVAPVPALPAEDLPDGHLLPVMSPIMGTRLVPLGHSGGREVVRPVAREVEARKRFPCIATDVPGASNECGLRTPLPGGISGRSGAYDRQGRSVCQGIEGLS